MTEREKILLDCVLYYADKSKWNKSHQMMYCLTDKEDRERFEIVMIGGKVARDTLAKLRDKNEI